MIRPLIRRGKTAHESSDCFFIFPHTARMLASLASKIATLYHEVRRHNDDVFLMKTGKLNSLNFIVAISPLQGHVKKNKNT